MYTEILLINDLREMDWLKAGLFLRDCSSTKSNHPEMSYFTFLGDLRFELYQNSLPMFLLTADTALLPLAFVIL
jgi:hypothetical protein